MVTIVSVKFRTAPKAYYFSPGKEIYKLGEFVIVETSRGMEFGEIVLGNKEIEEKDVVGELKPIIRRASQQDIDRNKENLEARKETMQKAVEKAAECKLEMKIVDAEYTFDRKKTIIYYTAESRVDFRDMVRKLAMIIPGRIEMRQIYERDNIILKGAHGICGQPCCCTTFLKEYAKSSIRMAKNQGLSLNPTATCGFCSRPMCCLKYEDDFYVQENKKMPKVKSRVITPDGEGVVQSCDVIKQKVVVRFYIEGMTTFKSYHVAEISPGDHRTWDRSDTYEQSNEAEDDTESSAIEKPDNYDYSQNEDRVEKEAGLKEQNKGAHKPDNDRNQGARNRKNKQRNQYMPKQDGQQKDSEKQFANKDDQKAGGFKSQRPYKKPNKNKKKPYTKPQNTTVS